MQLVFLWIDISKGILRDLNLRFSSQHICKYDMNSKVLRKMQSEAELNIFSEYAPPVTNVSVLVGENGSGKTSIMREIYELLRHRSKTCQFLALYYGKGSKANLNHEGYYWWSNIEKVDNDNNCPFTIEGFENNSFEKLSDEDVEDDFFIVRYTDVLSLNEYAKRDSMRTRNSCDLTMSYRLLRELEPKGSFTDRQDQDVVMQLYHAETERQIIALKQNLPVSLKRLEIIPCSEMNLEELEAMSSRKGIRWGENGASNSHDIKKKACGLCEEVVTTINSWENLSATDVLIRSVIYTYLRHVIGRYGIYSDEEMGAGIPAAIKREVNAPLIYLREKLALRSQYQSCADMENLFRGAFESVGVPFSPDQFILNLMCFSKWLLNSGDARYDCNAGRFYVDIEKASTDKLLEAFQCYKNSIGQYGEVVAFEFNMSSGERAFFNLFAYMNYARGQMKAADNPQIIREEGNLTKPNRTVILLLDELDAFLHPRWQQIGVKTLLDNISKIFADHDVQIIFSTHSPLLLSDIPLSHTIFIQKNNGRTEIVDKKFQTFADNIYRLYEDSFFMNVIGKINENDDIWIRGAFSDRIVNEAENIMCEIQDKLAAELSQVELSCAMDKMKRVDQIIKLIGEPFLQRLMLVKWHDICAMLQHRSVKESDD